MPLSHRHGFVRAGSARSGLRLAALLLLLPLPAAGEEEGPSDFRAAVEARAGLYRSAVDHPDNERDALHGHLERAHRRLEAAVPEAERTAADDFLLGDLFWSSDFERSYRYHARAYDAAPHEPAVALEMAYERHRRGDCASAAPLYEEVAQAGVLQPPQYALLAHCLVRLHRYVGAVHAWDASDHAHNHTGIDFAIYDVFGPLSPMARHDALLGRVRAGDTGAIDELLDNAVRWERDWWNGGTNWEAFEAGLEVATEALGPESRAARELRVYAEAQKTGDADALRALLRREKLILPPGGLPESSYVARRLVELALRRELATPRELAERHLDALIQRVRRREGEDVHALELVAGLLAATEQNDALPEFDRLGWKRHHLADFALSYLVGRQYELGDGFTHEDEKLREALRDFPDDPRFVRLALRLTARSRGLTADDLASLIDAEYHGLRSSPSRYSYELKGYFAALAQMLSAAPAAPGTE